MLFGARTMIGNDPDRNGLRRKPWTIMFSNFDPSILPSIKGMALNLPYSKAKRFRSNKPQLKKPQPKLFRSRMSRSKLTQFTLSCWEQNR